MPIKMCPLAADDPNDIFKGIHPTGTFAWGTSETSNGEIIPALLVVLPHDPLVVDLPVSEDSGGLQGMQLEVKVFEGRFSGRCLWHWDGCREQPTLSPSILSRRGAVVRKGIISQGEWHGFIRNGELVST